jgi:radical SAM superfamily enzyme YgiQ (UPF0313 family)
MQVILFTDIADTIGYGKYAGTYKLATEVRNHGYTCQVIDLFSFYSYEQLETIIDKFITSETILVGFSCSLMEKRVGTNVYNFGRPDEEFTSIVDYIKSKNSQVKICLGGARISLNSYWKGVDYIVVNKGDVAIIKLLKHLIDGDDLKTIKQTPCYVIDGNDYFYTQEQFAASSILYQDHDIIFQKEALPVEIARGCIFSCAFCRFDLIGKKVGDWQKHGSVLRDELVRNYELYGTTHYMFSDELINESLPKMQLIHEVFTKLPFNISYTAYARLDLIWRYPEMREMMLETGAVSLQFGIETLNDVAGKKIGKGLGEKKIKDTLAYIGETWKGKIITSSNFIIGLPGEDEASIRRTFDYLTSDECSLDIFTFLPLHIRTESDGRSSSKIERDPKKFGFQIIKDEPWVNDQMNFATAQGLVKEFWSNPKMLQRSKFAAATWLGRILNLGYSMEEIFKMILDKDTDANLLKDIFRKKSLEKKQQYYEQLMNI